VYNIYNIKLLDHQLPFALVHVVPRNHIIFRNLRHGFAEYAPWNNMYQQ